VGKQTTVYRILLEKKLKEELSTMIGVNKAIAINDIPIVALGEDEFDEVVEMMDQLPHSMEERVAMLEGRQEQLVQMMDNVFAILKDVRAMVQAESDQRVTEAINHNLKSKKLGIPEGTVLNGTTKGLSYFLQVKDGAFYVGNTRYDTLSAAAEAVSGVRRSGLTFWKLDDGKTVKEVFKRG
jgi:hypothetical protein